jgi:predicted membrane GTPase involved in stress response
VAAAPSCVLLLLKKGVALSKPESLHRAVGGLSLKQVLEFIADYELVEVTPKTVRLRRRVLRENERPERKEA